MGNIQNKKAVTNGIGRFDFMKGICMLLIVIEHTIGLFSIETVDVNPILGIMIGVIYKALYNGVMPAMFMISGMGFRVSKPEKSWKKQAKYLMIPYIKVACLTCILNASIHFLSFHYLKGALMETGKNAAGFLLGEAKTVHYFGNEIFPNGPVWYIYCLFFAWMILQYLFKLLNEKTTIGVGICVLAGWGLSVMWSDMPFSIPQTLIAVGYLYVGYIIKKKELLISKESLNFWILTGIFIMISCFAGDVDFAYNIWKLGPLDMIASAAVAFVLIKLFLQVNRFNNVIVNSIASIGKNSLWFICVHTVEFVAIPWYLFTNKTANMWMNLICIYLIRMSMILLGVKLIEIIKRRERKQKFLKQETHRI